MENKSNNLIDKELQQEGYFPFYFENLLEPSSFSVLGEIINIGEVLPKLDAIKELISRIDRKQFRNKTYTYELKVKEFYKTIFVLEIKKKQKWHITLTINKGVDIEKVMEQMRIYYELLNYLNKLGYGNKQ